MRRRVCNGALTHSGGSSRSVTTRGQFNPIHTFRESTRRGEYATSPEQFRTMIENPGPLQVQYSADYVDWYHRAYQEKVKAIKTKETQNQRFPLGGQVNGAFKRPSQSFLRVEGERRRQEAIQGVEAGCCEHGWLDVVERQAQFPSINIERASDFHVRELVKEFVVDRALSAEEVWDKALLYVALLQERENAYPQSFQFMKAVREAVTFAPKVVDASATEGSAATARVEHADKYPTEDHLAYFVYHTRKYQLENAIDGQVFLRCHRLADAERLLFSQPPPKDVEGPVPVRPKDYPSLTELLERPENGNLLRVLLFGELNLVVSLNPFVKFPFAETYLTRPNFEVLGGDISGGKGAHGNKDSAISASMSQVLLARRGEQYPPLTSGNLSMIDARARDVQRLQRGQEQDMRAFRRTQLQLLSEKDPAGYALNGGLTWNPRVTRAEVRDVSTRAVVRHMKAAAVAKTQYVERSSLDVYTAETARPKTEERDAIPTYAPTIPHFLSLILSDPVVHFLVSTSPNLDRVDTLRKAAHQLAKQFFSLAVCFHKEDERRVAKQKVIIAAAVFDDEVKSQRAARLQEEHQVTAAVSGESAANRLNRQHRTSSEAGRLPAYIPFASRPLEQHGFPTEGRFDDYVRWMKPNA